MSSNITAYDFDSWSGEIAATFARHDFSAPCAWDSMIEYLCFQDFETGQHLFISTYLSFI